MSNNDGPVKMEVNSLRATLHLQTILLEKLTEQISELKDIPVRIAVIESKLDNLSSIDTSLQNVATTTTQHATMLRILGYLTGVLFPVIFAWTMSLRSDLTQAQIALSEISAVVRTQEKYNAEANPKKN